MPKRVKRRATRIVACVLSVMAAVALLSIDAPPGAAVAQTGLRQKVLESRPLLEQDDPGDDGDFDRSLAVPTGAPSAIACDDARRVVAQALAGIAAPVAPVDPAKFADALTDWLDPHGLWSVAPDSPVAVRIKSLAARVLGELEAPPESAPCVAAEEIGAELLTWTGKLRAVYDDGFREGRSGRLLAAGSAEAFRLASFAPFEEGPVTRSGRDLSRDLGREAGQLRRTFGEAMAPFTDAARERVAPALDRAGWSRVERTSRSSMRTALGPPSRKSSASTISVWRRTRPSACGRR
jgi:carboxyl-terminal processing protease